MPVGNGFGLYMVAESEAPGPRLLCFKIEYCILQANVSCVEIQTVLLSADLSSSSSFNQ
jgi:hypothetical protein